LTNAFLAGIRVSAVDPNTIELVMSGMSQTYRQVEPYVYRAATPDTLTRMSHELVFQRDQGKVTGFSANAPFDAEVTSFRDSMPALILGVIVVVCTALFFAVAPLVMLVRYLRKRETSPVPFTRVSNGLLLSGTLLVANNLIFVASLLENFSPAGPFIQSSVVAPFVWLNYLVLAIVGVFLVTSLYLFRKGVVKAKRRVVYFVTIALLLLFTVVLYQWNFFTLM
jgi:hypothetical protein